MHTGSLLIGFCILIFGLYISLSYKKHAKADTQNQACFEKFIKLRSREFKPTKGEIRYRQILRLIVGILIMIVVILTGKLAWTWYTITGVVITITTGVILKAFRNHTNIN